MADSESESDKSKSKLASLSDCIRHVTVEPILVLFSFGMGLFYVASSMMYIEKVCKVNLNLTSEICDNLTSHEPEQEEVQKYVAELQAYNTIIQTIPSVIIGLFAGGWSDTHGRKLIMIFPLFGFIILNGVFLLNTYFFMELKAEFLLFEFLQDLTGGGILFYIGAYAYVCEVTTKENRTKRLSYVNAISPCASCLGNSAGGYIKKYVGYYGNFGLGLLFSLMSLLWTIFILKDPSQMKIEENEENLEEIKEEEEDEGKTSSTVHPLLWVIFGPFLVLIKKRKGNLRRILISLLIGYILLCLIGNTGSVSFLFWRKKFKFSEIELGNLWAAWGLASLVMLYLVLPILSEKFKLHDSTIAMIGLCSAIQYLLTIYLLPDTGVPLWVFYINELISAACMFTWTAMRSLTTKCVNHNEFGKVFGVFGAITSMLPMISAPIYAFIYKHTVETDPGAFLLVQLGLYCLPMALLGSITWSMRNNKTLTRRSTIRQSYALTVVASKKIRESLERQAQEEDWDPEGAMEQDKFPQPLLMRQNTYLK